MKIAIMTDMEGVAGIKNFKDWIYLDSSHFFRDGQRLLTEEVNAAADGFFSGGATEVVVIDGHATGKGISPELLDERALLAAHSGLYPCCLDSSYQGLAFVGQHAKAGTPYSHLTHTGGFEVIDYTINGLSVGEYGQMALCAMELGVPTFFAAGEDALAREAQALTSGVVTVSVKWGLVAEDDGYPLLTGEQYANKKRGAIHLAPRRARALIRDGARRAMETLRIAPQTFQYPALKPPYQSIVRLRPTSEKPGYRSVKEHPDSIIGLFSLPAAAARREDDKEPQEPSDTR